MYKFTKLLTIENKIVLRKPAAYVYYALKKKETWLFILMTETFQSTVLLYCFICILKCAWQTMYLPLINKHYYYY